MRPPPGRGFKRLVNPIKLPQPRRGKFKVTPAMAGAAGACSAPMNTIKFKIVMKENGRSPFSEWRFPPVQIPAAFCNAGRPVCVSVGQSVSVSVQGLSSIAPDRRSRSGRLRSQKMRQSAGKTMVLVTWRHVSRVARHVPPREPFEKKLTRLQPKRGVAGSPNFQAREALV